MNTPKALTDAFSHHLTGLMSALSAIVADGTKFDKYVGAVNRCFLDLIDDLQVPIRIVR